MERKAIVVNERGDRSYRKLKLLADVYRELSCGVELRRVWTQSDGAMVAETHNAWDRGDGCSFGTRYEEMSGQDALCYSERFGLAALLPTDAE